MPGTLPGDGFVATEEWVVGPQETAFFTKSWAPPESIKPVAYLLIHHGLPRLAFLLLWFTPIAF